MSDGGDAGEEQIELLEKHSKSVTYEEAEEEDGDDIEGGKTTFEVNDEQEQEGHVSSAQRSSLQHPCV